MRRRLGGGGRGVRGARCSDPVAFCCVLKIVMVGDGGGLEMGVARSKDCLEMGVAKGCVWVVVTCLGYLLLLGMVTRWVMLVIWMGGSLLDFVRFLVGFMGQDSSRYTGFGLGWMGRRCGFGFHGFFLCLSGEDDHVLETVFCGFVCLAYTLYTYHTVWLEKDGVGGVPKRHLGGR